MRTKSAQFKALKIGLMRNRLSILVMCIFVVLIPLKFYGSQYQFAEQLPEILTPCSNPTSFSGDIVPSSDSTEGKFWTPTSDDIVRVEKGLSEYILSVITMKKLPALLPKYHRFYYGHYKNGKKVIFIWLSYDSGYWKNKSTQLTPETEMPTFTLNFDVQTGRFFDFREENFF